jgi:hypothetical protein
MSVKPNVAVDILNGNATILIVKKLPKLDPPYEMYLYVTKKLSKRVIFKKGEQIGENEYTDKNIIVKIHTPFEFWNGGKVVAKCTVTNVVENRNSQYQLIDYHLYFNNLQILEKPKGIGEFVVKGSFERNDFGVFKDNKSCYYKRLTKAPSTWCYVEVEK